MPLGYQVNSNQTKNQLAKDTPPVLAAGGLNEFLLAGSNPGLGA